LLRLVAWVIARSLNRAREAIENPDNAALR
jgi:hypothetical protein